MYARVTSARARAAGRAAVKADIFSFPSEPDGAGTSTQVPTLVSRRAGKYKMFAAVATTTKKKNVSWGFWQFCSFTLDMTHVKDKKSSLKGDLRAAFFAIVCAFPTNVIGKYKKKSESEIKNEP